MNRQRRTKALPVAISEKAAGHSGVMLALFIPASALPRVTALQDGLPSPEPADDLHLTLAYLGDRSTLAYQRESIEQMLRSTDWVSFGLPLAGRIGGVGRFHHDEGDGTNAVYASFDAPGLPMFRQRLVEQLKLYGIMPAENHGFTPHITLAYVPTDAEVATTAPVELPELVFGALTLAWGDERVEFGPWARPASLSVFKDASGRWRWVTRTTTAYRDRDGEIISTKALADDVAWSDTHGQYGPLRWWHTGDPNPRYTAWGPEAWGPGLDIGDCDLRAMSGNCLMESGTFRDEAVGAAIAAKAEQYGISPGFFHSVLEPDADGVYSRIKTFERSLVPLWRGTPANLYTRLMVQEVQPMDAAKRKAWEEAGVPAGLIDQYIQDNKATEKSAQDAGVTFKESDAPPAAAAPPVAETPATPDPTFIGDLAPDAFVALVQQANQPLIAALATNSATKTAAEQANATAVKAAQEGLAATNQTLVDLQTTLKAERAATDAKIDLALKAIAELQGDLPAAVKRASQDPATIVAEGSALKDAKPHADTEQPADGSMFGDFWNSFGIPGQPGQGG